MEALKNSPLTWQFDLMQVHGELLRARKRLGLRQRDLADRLGCSEKHIGRCERAEQDETAEFLFRWCDALGIRVKVEGG